MFVPLWEIVVVTLSALLFAGLYAIDEWQLRELYRNFWKMSKLAQEGEQAAVKSALLAQTETARLHSIHENGLCGEWLKECDLIPNEVTWEAFLELVDEQVAMDEQERTPEFQAELLKSLEDTEMWVLELQEEVKGEADTVTREG